ncbi:MAG: XdhC family protein [Candidatus Promineofilum sp.]|nr:XdhC family protein [Promineifilum sp.]
MNGEDRQILEELLAAQTRREPVVLAVVIRDQGSVPRHAGSKMLIYGDGRTLGSVGGGEMEARVAAAARDALGDGRPRVIPYSLVDPQRGDPGVCGGNVEIYVEPYSAPDTLFILGCGHVGRALAGLGRWLGFRVVAWDDRAELATRENMADADVVLSGPPAELFAQATIDERTYLAVVTRNVTLDRQLLPLALETPAAYIGVMGSRRRWQETKRLLAADGLPSEKLGRVTSPIGLELNAESPHEIAVSIMAQIITIQRGGKDRPVSIVQAAEKTAP